MSHDVSKRYAKAFFAAWQQDLSLEKIHHVLETCQAFVNLLKTSPEISAVWISPGFHRDEKTKLIRVLEKQQVISQEIVQMLMFLVEKKRTAIFQPLIQDLYDLYYRQARILRVVVTSASELSGEDQASVQKSVQSLPAAADMNCEFSFTVDTQILGGMIIKMGQYVYDYSIHASLGQLRRSIENLSPRELASRSDV